MFVLLVINLITTIKATRPFVCSSSATLTSDVTRMHSNDGSNLLYRTTIQISLRQDETVCFSVGKEGQEMGEGTRYALTMSKRYAKYTYKDLYEFGIPDVEAKCTCQCSNVEDECENADTDMCNDKRNCVNKFYNGQSAKGCIDLISSSSTKVCCGVYFTDPTQIWQAVELKRQGDIAVIGVTEGYNKGNINSVPYPVYIDEKTPLKNFEITITNSGNTMLPQQWYYGHADGKDLFEATKGLNTKNSFEVNKLGWLKYNRTMNRFDSRSKWGSEFRLDTKKRFDCGANEFSSQFGGQSQREEEKTRKVIEDKHKDTIANVNRDDKKRQVTYDYIGHEKVLELDITMSGNLPIAQYTDDSTLRSIKAEMSIDAHNSRFVNFTISGGGTIDGTIQDLTKPDIVENFVLNIPIAEKIVQIVKLKGIVCTKKSRTKICAHPKLRDEREEKKELCINNVKCNLEKIPGYLLPNNTIETIGGDKNSLLSTKYWLRYLNPLEWFNGISGWQEGLMLFVEVAGILGVIGLILKVAKVMGCLGKCCSFMFCCCLCPKTKEKFNKNRRYTKRRMTEGYSIVKKKLQVTKSQKVIIDRLAKRPTFVDLKRRLNWREDQVVGFMLDNAGGDDVTIINSEVQNVDNKSHVVDLDNRASVDLEKNEDNRDSVNKSHVVDLEKNEDNRASVNKSHVVDLENEDNITQLK